MIIEVTPTTISISGIRATAIAPRIHCGGPVRDPQLYDAEARGKNS